MKKTKKALSILFALLLTLPSLASCGNVEEKQPDNTGDTTAQQETTPETTEEDARIAIPDDLPEMDLKGRKLRILTYSPQVYFTEDITGELVNDTKYDRQLYMAERFNAGIEAIDSSTFENLDSSFRNSVSSGDDAYDIAIPHMIKSCPSFITQNLLLDWNTVEYINQQKPWWNQTINETISILGKQFYIAGYITIPVPFGMLINKDMAENFGYGDIYNTVREKKWTLDKLAEMCDAVDNDMNGDGAMKGTDDRYGLGMNYDNHLLNFMYSCGIHSVILDENKMPVVNINTDEMLALMEKLDTFINKSGTVYMTSYEDEPIYRDAFNDGRILIHTGEVGRLSEVRDVGFTVGVIPYPMWNEEQGYYATHVDAWNGVLCIPTTAHDVNEIGLMVEAMAAYTYKYVVPAYFDVTLGKKLAQDKETKEMLDIIYDSITYDFGYVFDNWNGCTWVLPRTIPAGNTNLASYWKGIENTINHHYKELYDKVAEYNT